MKKCTACKKKKSLTEFFKDNSKKDGHKPQCKGCHTAGSKPGDAARARKYRAGKGKETSKLYRQNNKGKVLARINKRRAAKISATPNWFEKEQIEQLYTESCEMTKIEGKHYVIDHIVPLLHKKVCGLHCIANLQILSFKENHLKNNTFDI